MTTKDDADTSRILAEIRRLEQEAYDRGYNDALTAILSAAGRVAEAKPAATSPTPPSPPRKRGRRPKAPGIVLGVLETKPGMTGVEVVAAVEATGNTISERTVRTALRRLKGEKRIIQRRKRWFPAMKPGSADVAASA